MPFDGVELSQVTEQLLIGRVRIKAGWCQYHLHRVRWTWHGKHHDYCLMAAVLEDPGRWAMTTRDMAGKLLAKAIVDLGYGHMQLAEFNDSPGRTKSEVLDVLDLAIAMSRGMLTEFNDSPGRTNGEVLDVLDLAIAMSRGMLKP
jgi:hypothetical protein